ncbi:ethylene-insensitive protein 2.1 [Humulus lupulus]|uniref:ethylene-insensitive protein 2.1 n=1 Tax=Humulus lupulus TaxID=3486 RepID=UPI002B404F4C|nr:ethylene-insensitive protein 2.1 [Humulus lupulus]XP_062117256.1 ethylene-insensitive protein 2.1 [Humulus lupulus]
METSVHRLAPFAVPALLISVGYVDPGKWAATVEGGARLGYDLLALMLVFNLAAILCQYLSARIGVVTGRDLAQICSVEYDKWTCLFLGVQTELSMILLDLTMVLGIAHGLNHLFEWDLFTCVFLTAIDAVLFPLFSTLLENCKVKFLCIYVAGFILLSSVLGVLINHPEMTLFMSVPTKLSGESAFAVMSLLGSSIMPHNFYLHSSIVQHHGPSNVSKDALCHNHFFAILCIFSGIYVVNYVLMNSAANVFYSTGLDLLTFHDAMSLVEQVLRGPIAPIAFLLVLFVSNQITALTWSVGGQAVLHDFLKLEIPGWLHCATIRIIAVIPALYCVWSSGAEGMYQLLIFTQVLVALLLPSSVIPLFRIATSRPIMGLHKISQIFEFLSFVTFIGMLGLKIVFVVEMVFGNSDWVVNLWNVGSSMSASYAVLLIIACVSFCLMLWLLATPLKSASVFDAQLLNWDIMKVKPDSFTNKEDIDITKSRYHGEAHIEKQESSPVLGKALDSQSDRTGESFDFNLPESLMDPDQDIQLSTVEENSSINAFSSSSVCDTKESTPVAETVAVSTVVNEVSNITLIKNSVLRSGTKDLVEKIVAVEVDVQADKDDDEGDTWETEELSKGVPGTPSMQSEGPGSFRSLSGKSDDGGNGAGSLSRLAGLGRAARRQLAAVLDEFWGQLYDFHGQATPDARAKKLDVLFGIDITKAASSSLKVDTSTKDVSGYFSSVGGRGSDPLINSSLYDSPKQQRVQSNLDSQYGGVQRGQFSLGASHTQMLDNYVQSSRNDLDFSERRYSSVRNLPSSESWGDYQPATVHGYQIASYVNRFGKERSSDNLNGQLQSPAFKSSAIGSGNYRDSFSFAMGQKLQNGLSTSQVSNLQNLLASRNSSLQTERPYYSPGITGTAENVVSSANTKKYHSLPDIHRDLHASDKIPQWQQNPSGFGSSLGRTGYEQSQYATSGLRTGAPLAFDELSPSKDYRDALSSPLNTSFDTSSLWSRQPFEQFGVADTTRTVDSGAGSRMSTVNQEAASFANAEAKLLQSFRHCIVKLLKLEGSDWLFRQNDGVDEDLIDRVAAREKFLYDAETKDTNWGTHMGDHQYSSPERKYSSLKNIDSSYPHSTLSSVPHCGEGCVWKSDLIVSFGVWCIHRVLDLSLMESRPELWGKYTYVLNRLQGIVDVAFSKPRTPMTPCFCLHIPASAQQRFSPPVTNGMLPPAAKPAKGKCTTAAVLLDTIKDVEIAISCRKGRTGTAAGDVAFPKGKENLASVLKRYRRRLSNKPIGAPEGSGSRKMSTSAVPYVS